MPIKLIGRKTDFSGKTLWEIVGNLKNLGVGRLVKRNMFERYPEPSFFRIAKVHTEKNEVFSNVGSIQKVLFIHDFYFAMSNLSLN